MLFQPTKLIRENGRQLKYTGGTGLRGQDQSASGLAYLQPLGNAFAVVMPLFALYKDINSKT
jgi:hypothetical protein